MKAVKFVSRLLVFLFIFSGLAVISCKKKALTPEIGRLKPDRGITIINNIGSPIKGYAVNAGSGGSEIAKGTAFTGNSIYLIISDSWKNDPNLEVVLVDQYNKIYKNTANVPLEGNTDIRIGTEHRVSEGSITDAIRDLTEWINKHK